MFEHDDEHLIKHMDTLSEEKRDLDSLCSLSNREKNPKNDILERRKTKARSTLKNDMKRTVKDTIKRSRKTSYDDDE
jgi:hypothetical protein